MVDGALGTVEDARIVLGAVASKPIVSSDAAGYLIGKKINDEVIEEIITTGTRRAARSVTDSPVPVDVISAEDMISQGATDMNSLLRGVVPSYNVNDQKALAGGRSFFFMRMT